METCDLIVAGAGPAGIAAACEATRHGLNVILVDPRPIAGGQYYARPPSGVPFAGLPRAVTSGIASERLAFWARSEVWGAFDGLVAITTPAGTRLVTPRAVVIATGAIERPQPFPGWERPSVMTAGAAQLLLKEHHVVLQGRVVVAGSGPFLVAVAAQLRQAGTDIAALIEATPGRVLARRLLRLIPRSAYVQDAARFTWLVRDVRRIFGARITEAGEKTVALSTGEQIPYDVLCVGHGFEPRLALARLLGCSTDGGVVAVDRDQRTSRGRVYAAGEATGIGGAALATVEGRIAGLTAACDLIEDTPARQRRWQRQLARRRVRLRSSSALLLDAYTQLDPLALADDDTIICRCEAVTLRDVRAACRSEPPAEGTRALKALLRCGMGACQGAFCAQPLRAAVSQGGEFEPGIETRVRPPIATVRVGDVAQLTAISDGGWKPEQPPS